VAVRARQPTPWRALDELRRVAESGENVMPASIALAHAGGTTGEWAGGAARGVRRVPGAHRRVAAAASGTAWRGQRRLREVAERVKAMPRRPPGCWWPSPGLDGHSNGAEQIAVAARDAGMEVIYQGIRSRPSRSPRSARDEDVDVIGLSILSGSHLELVPEVGGPALPRGVDAPVVVGGIIPEDDRRSRCSTRRGRRLHAEGLRAHPDHGRHRRPRRRPPRSIRSSEVVL
jgi:ethylmalonyl-CoA mutase